MSANNAPFGLGSSGLAVNAAVYNTNIGRQWMINGATWRLVKANGALATPQRQALVTTLTNGLPTYSVTTSVTAADYLSVGFAKSDQVALASGDFFLVQTSGYTEGISAAAIAAGALIGTSTTAGKIDDATVTAPTAMGVALEAAAGVDEFVGLRIIHLS